MTDDQRQYDGDGERRLSWRAEAEVLHGRLDTIEAVSRATHDTVVAHVAEERETKAAIEELILLWRGSKMMVSAAKILIPIAAALVGAAVWVKDHVKW
jgi:hypothetical protein